MLSSLIHFVIPNLRFLTVTLFALTPWRANTLHNSSFLLKPFCFHLLVHLPHMLLVCTFCIFSCFRVSNFSASRSTVFCSPCINNRHDFDFKLWPILVKQRCSWYHLPFVTYSTASDVQLADSSFHDSEFDLISGMKSVKWERILPGTNVTHLVVLRPIKSGAFNFTSAVVQYVASEGSDPTVNCLLRLDCGVRIYKFATGFCVPEGNKFTLNWIM